MADHSDFVQQYPGAIVTNFVRVNPVFLNNDIGRLYNHPEEVLLGVMHTNDGKLLMLSNQRFIVYKIPAKRSFLRRTGGAMFSMATSMTIDMIPVVSDIGTMLDGVGAGKTIRDRFAKTEAGMPAKRDIRNLVWDIDDEKICRMIISYKDRILLENSFDWPVEFEMSLDKILKKRTEIAIGSAEISGKLSGKKVSFNLANPQIGYVLLAKKLVEYNIDQFQTAGWQPTIVDNKLLIKK